jgi:hypothetical protein
MKFLQTENEIWKPIPGYEGLYEVSSIGRIKALPKRIKGNNGGVRFQPEMIMKLNPTKHGYLHITLCNQRNEKTWKVHRLVALVFVDNPHNKPIVNHIDNDKTNNAAWNLEWVTYKENTQHYYKTFNDNKYTYEQVKEVYELVASGLSQKQITEKTGIQKPMLDAMRYYGSYSYYGFNFKKLLRLKKAKYPGVRQQKSGKWLARVQMNKKRTELGRFKTEEEAIRACEEYKRKYTLELAA